MPKFASIFFFLLLCITLAACNTLAVEGLQIPDVPSLEKNKKQDGALTALTDAINLNATGDENYFKRALIYINLENYTLALADIDKAISLKENGKYFYTKAAILNKQGQFQASISNMERSRLLGYNSSESLTLLGDLYQQARQFNKATQFLKNAIQIDPNDGENFYFLGLIAAKKADTLSAITFFNNSLALKPSYLNNYQQLSAIYLIQRNYNQAFYFLNKGLTFHPNSDKLWLLKSSAYLKSWKIDSAFYCLRKVEKMSPQNDEATFQLAQLYFKSGDFVNALRYYGKTLELNPQIYSLNYQMGLCAEYLGNSAKALEFYTIATRLHPEDYKSLTSLQRVRQQLSFSTSTSESLDYLNLTQPLSNVSQTRTDTTIMPARFKVPISLELKPRTNNNKVDSLLKKHINAIDKIH